MYHYHRNTTAALRDLLCSAGLEHPSEVTAEHILRRVSPIEVRSIGALYRFLQPGELLEGMPEHAVFKDFWAMARSDSFAAPRRTQTVRVPKAIDAKLV